jgi:hypothetical protein
MHSSISSFEGTAAFRRAPSAERLTAADRPGVAQPVPERPVPRKPWGPIAASVLLVVAVVIGAWEWQTRRLGLVPGDLRDGPSFWAEQRRRIDHEPVQVAIVGDSRILFDTDLARFEALTGVRPLQLALPGTNGRPFLQNVAADPDFKGVLLVGMADLSYFRDDVGLMAGALDRYTYESPAQRSSFVLHRALSRVFGFMDENYRLSLLLQRLDPGLRVGARSPYQTPWKFSTVGEDRQAFLWSRIETDPYLNGHARWFWQAMSRQVPVPDETVANTQRITREAVAQIRARGGDVIFLRPPSAGERRVAEEKLLGRARGWDALLRAADARGLHAFDDPVTANLYLPEVSHLSRACATVYTDAYVRALAKLSLRVRLRADAPRALTPADCVPPNPIPATATSAVAGHR